jgi:hypothetical protein
VSRGVACLLALAVLAGPAAGRPAGATDGRRHSALEGTPGYTPPSDPDSMAVIRGRRPAPAVRMKLTGGVGSLDSLATAILQSIDDRDRARLEALCVTRREFETILWPEFPQSRPITGVTAGDGWYFAVRQNLGGVSRTLSEHDDGGPGGWTLVKVECHGPLEHYRNFTLHRGLTIVARDKGGNVRRFDLLRTAVERQGVFKIYALRD